MATRIFVFLLGVWLFQFSREIPPLILILSLLLVSAAALYRSRFMLLALFVLGMVWAAGHATIRALDRLPPEHEGRELTITGVVVSIPNENPHRQRFLFQVDGLDLEGKHYPGPGMTRLSWYEGNARLAPGERWQLSVKLRRPRGTFNPGSFNYEAWLYQQGINATGYVLKSDRNLKLGERFVGVMFQRLRFYALNTLASAIPDKRALGLVSALITGERSGIDDKDWRIFRETGTTHLFAISGLHIGIVSGLFLLLGNIVWRRLPRVSLWLPTPKFAACLALIAAFLYAGLAGFSVPTQRALIMLVVLLGASILGRHSTPIKGLCWALLAIVLYDPLAPLSFGFWLSFAAVFVILTVLQWRCRDIRPAYSTVIRLQWAVFLGLTPLLLMMGLGVSLLAPLVNLLVVPIFSLLLVPWIFAAFVLLITVPPIGQWLLLWAAKALVFQVDILAGIIAFEMVELYRPPLTPMVYVALIVGFMLFLFPRGVPGRPLCVLFFLPLFAVSPVRPSKGDFWVTQLDVGQGLALVISTHNHLLLYDTGPRYRGGFDAGESVVTPYLRHAGYSRIDRVILSNGDMDHRGGFRSLYSAFGVTDVYSGEPNKIKFGTVHRCYAGQKWHWDGVDFEVLHPSPESSWQGNSASCVLRVSNRSGVLLATGDIERAAELSLLRQTLGALRADVVTVPHHGSKSSSIRAFTEAVSASIAMVSAGYGNRYGFPKKEIVDRWQESGSAVYSSFESGALSIRFSQSTGISTPHSYRQQMKRYWMSD